jgi:hypothetical protein
MKTRPKHLYLALCIVGAIVPYSQFIPWIAAHGFDLRLLVEQLFANRISAFFAVDVILSAIVLVVFASTDGRRLGIKHWWLPVLATLLVGVSFGLPLFLYMREAHLERPAS